MLKLLRLAVLAIAMEGCGKTDEPQGDILPARRPVAHVLGFSGAGYLYERDQASADLFLSTMGYGTGAAGQEAYYDDAVARMQELGAPMARAEMWYVGAGTFRAQTTLYARMSAAGFEIVGQFNPTPDFEVPDPAFEAGLDALVRAHPEIHAWQIGNEPDLTWQDYRQFAPFFLRAQPVIRSACPSCRILLAGISNQYESSASNVARYGEILDAIAAGNLEQAFDVFDFHYYKAQPSRTEIENAVSTYRGLLETRGLSAGVSFWCTETGTYTGDPPDAPGTVLPPRTETDQARDLVRLAAWMSAAGVERVFQWTVVECWGNPGIPGFFDQMGLVYNGLGEEPAAMAGTEKKAYTTYALLAHALVGVTGATRIADGVYRFERDTGPAFLVWDEAGAGSVTLTGLAWAVARVQTLVPGDDGVAGASDVPVSNGEIVLSPGDLPVLVMDSTT